MERKMLERCLAERIPAVQVLARGLPPSFSLPVHRAMNDGLLLIMTPFDAKVTKVSAERAVWCNQYALHLARHIVVGQLNPGGLLDCLLTDLSEDKPCWMLGSPGF